MDERARRYGATTEATALGWGGVTAVAQATGWSRNTIMAGIREVERGFVLSDSLDQPARLRRPGGGRKPLIETDHRLLRDRENLLEASTRGDPQSPSRWATKSSRHLADERVRLGYQVSYPTVTPLLNDLDYSLQANRKTQEGADHPDRDEQFEPINQKAIPFPKRRQPVISVDTKKKELMGDFKQPGRE